MFFNYNNFFVLKYKREYKVKTIITYFKFWRY